MTLGPGMWMLLTFFCALAAACLTYAITRARLERRAEADRQALADARAALEAERQSFKESARAIEENARRTALDEFLADMRVEERRYVREHRLLFAHRKSLVLQERMYFRNIPLSNWVEHEVPVEEGADVDSVAKTMSLFNALELDEPRRARRLLF